MARRRRVKDERKEDVRQKRAAELRKRNLRKTAVFAIVVALLIGAVSAIVILSTSGPSAQGETAPDFTLVDSRGQSFSLSDFRGQPVVLFFMTTGDWCLPCQVETRDHLRPLYDTFHDSVQIISLELIPADYDDDDLNAFAAAYGSDWIYARDTAGVAQRFGVTTLSTVVIVDASGYVVFSGADPTFDKMASVLIGLGIRPP